MAEWCASNLRNCSGWKLSGFELSTTSDENAKLLDACVRQLISMTDCESLGGFEKCCEKLEASDPNGVMSQAFLLGLSAALVGKDAAIDPTFSKKLDKLEVDAEKLGNDWEKRHAKAVLLWGRGKHLEATSVWDCILDDYPNDLIAIRCAHNAHFFNGNAKGLLASIEKVIFKIDPTTPCYSFLHGMYAFALEEAEKYVDAEKSALHALSLNRYDCWAAHAVAHVMEMNGRHREGLEFMYKTEEDWKKGWMLKCHNYWHTALFHVEFGEYDSALEIFDREVNQRFNETEMLLDMTDAISMLWRLELEGVDVGKKRWGKILKLKDHTENHSIVFNDVHVGLALYRQEDQETEGKLRRSLEEYSNSLLDDNALISKSVGLPLYDGMLHFAKGNYDLALETMYPIRKDVVKIGGSTAQRDLFTQTLIHSSILSRQPENWNLAPELLMEREASKFNSHLGQRLADKYRIVHSLG